MTSDKGYISISLDLRAEISRSAEVGIEQLKAQQLQHLAKARSQVESVRTGIEKLKASEGNFWSNKIWELSQIFSKLHQSQTR